MNRVRWLLATMIGLLGLVLVPEAAACGGLFCQNTPVDQQAERIIFTVNKNDTITANINRSALTIRSKPQAANSGKFPQQEVA